MVYTAVENLHKTNDSLEACGIHGTEVSLTRIATNMANPSREDMLKLVRMLDALEDLDDVQETYVNVDIPEDLLEEE
jgi:transcriptional/translational regulatory protein YebC/TACO1